MTTKATNVSEGLEPCPFCGSALTIGGGCNPWARCDTEGCWMNARAVVVVLDDPRQVEAWNTRASPPLPSPLGVERRRGWDEGMEDAAKLFDGMADHWRPGTEMRRRFEVYAAQVRGKAALGPDPALSALPLLEDRHEQ